MGYHRAGYDVTGWDLVPHPDYPFQFHLGDALEVLNDHDYLNGFDVVHVSPPCPRYSLATPAANRENHPDLIGPVRDLLRAWGGPYVIENVPGAPLHVPVKLCGSMFGLQVRRHRLFETNVPMMQPECDHRSQPVVYGVYGEHGDGGIVYLRPGTGTSRAVKAADAAHARDLLGIDWMGSWADLADAIPPAYTHYLGEQLLEVTALA